MRKSLGTLLASCLVVLALVEVTARMFFRAARDHALPRRLVTIDDHLGWRLAKNVTVTHATADFRVDYSINSLGFRGREPRTTTDTRPFRILLYGDSQVFGWGVPAERRFSDRLEDQLDSAEVWNLAVPGYGVDQQALAYARDGADFDAAAVALWLSQATLHRLFFDYLYGIHKPSFRLRPGSGYQVVPPKSRPRRELLYRLPSWLYFPYMLDQALTGLEQRLGVGRLAPRETGSRVELVREILRMTLRQARSRRQRLVVLADLPLPDEDRLREACAELGVGFLTVGLPRERRELVLGEQDPHWNAAAHELIAGQLAPQIAAVER